MSWSSKDDVPILTVYASGAHDEASGQAAIAVFLAQREYSDYDKNELMTLPLEPFDVVLAGYWMSSSTKDMDREVLTDAQPALQGYCSRSDAHAVRRPHLHTFEQRTLRQRSATRLYVSFALVSTL
ncbi:hypothetical protein BDZ90DRAFT_233898 [Jaminaea rosea]|uniref:Uncharacterized protein n=1 Tax=Jaminaea rosea TaxID=1569628 RepID=A0A316UKR6_9BASI|nr:hypothetical protein BDZ90DRAFT_233898 [Jaminaea rosea]PWN25892.1 hypothetical protein BDZ90DRAFT_233898 [Jaminaea rosea]